jgi:hypothetical protein
MPRIARVTAIVSAARDDDLRPLPDACLAASPGAVERAVKPTVSAGSRGTRRYCRDQVLAAHHVGTLLDAGRDTTLQPYLDAVDACGEIALPSFDGVFSQTTRKAALLKPDAVGSTTPPCPRRSPRACIDLIRDADGTPAAAGTRTRRTVAVLRAGAGGRGPLRRWTAAEPMP